MHCVSYRLLEHRRQNVASFSLDAQYRKSGIFGPDSETRKVDFDDERKA
jgi:hypothetical protein